MLSIKYTRRHKLAFNLCAEQTDRQINAPLCEEAWDDDDDDEADK
jgi:hypothetical protein